jgi:hypothetical protein
MFETKVFQKETIEFSVAPDPSKEDILRVRPHYPSLALGTQDPGSLLCHPRALARISNESS